MKTNVINPNLQSVFSKINKSVDKVQPKDFKKAFKSSGVDEFSFRNSFPDFFTSEGALAQESKKGINDMLVLFGLGKNATLKKLNKEISKTIASVIK